jgi:hypothetical protein
VLGADAGWGGGGEEHIRLFKGWYPEKIEELPYLQKTSQRIRYMRGFLKEGKRCYGTVGGKAMCWAVFTTQGMCAYVCVFMSLIWTSQLTLTSLD